MKRPILSMLLSVLLLLPGCTQAPSGSSQEEGLTVLATTYPVYLFARTVAQGVEGVTVERLNTGSVSCLHDYTCLLYTSHHAAGPEQGDGARSKGLGGGGRPHCGQLQHQVRPPGQGPARPGPLVRCGAGAPLDPVAAHDSDDGACLLYTSRCV